MRAWTFAIVSILGGFAAGCSGLGGSSPSAEAPASPASPPSAEAGTAHAATTAAPAGLPDLGRDLQRGACENGPGAEGADSYFLGAYTLDGDQVSGWERWQLFANAKWKARGGRDCSIEWHITGRTEGVHKCGSCDLGLRVHGQADVEGSDCPEELVKGHRAPTGEIVGGEAVDFDQIYDVERRADGTARIYFGKSGKLLGEGYHDAHGIVWRSAHSCRWF